MLSSNIIGCNMTSNQTFKVKVTLEGQMFELAFLTRFISPTFFEGISLNLYQI